MIYTLKSKPSRATPSSWLRRAATGSARLRVLDRLGPTAYIIVSTSRAAQAATPAQNAAEGQAEPATLFRRLAALVYDAFLVTALVFAFTFTVVRLRGSEIEPGTPWFAPAIVAIAVAFYGWFWTRAGQTLGMQAWRIRVTSEDGGPVTWRQALLRFFAAWLSALPAGLGYFWVWVDPERRAWHDRLSGTRTVRVRTEAR